MELLQGMTPKYETMPKKKNDDIKRKLLYTHNYANRLFHHSGKDSLDCIFNFSQIPSDQE